MAASATCGNFRACEGFPLPGGGGSIGTYPRCRPLRDRHVRRWTLPGAGLAGTLRKGNLQVEIPERADCAPSARWRQQGTVHRDRICGAAGRADQRLRPRRHCVRAGAVAELLSAADWSRFTVASAGCRSSAVLLAGVYLAQDGRLISRCGRDEGSKGDRDAARHTAYGDRRRTYRRDRVPARPRAPSWPWCWVTPPVTGCWDHDRSATGLRRRAGRQHIAASRWPSARP